MKAIAYTRVSKDEQTEVQQIDAIEAWAKRGGIEIDSVHVDHDVRSVAPIDKRPALLSAIDALKKGYVLVVVRRDRIARDVVLAAMIERLVQRKGARIVSVAGEGTEDDSPSNKLMRTIVDAFAAYERQLISARTKAALASKKARGERTGNVPFGMKMAGPSMVEDEGEQEVIRIIRESVSRGVSYQRIVNDLGARGIVGRTGTPLGRTQVVRIAKAS